MTSLKNARAKSQALKTLGLTANAKPADIRSAFRRLAMTKHPDRCGGSNEEFLKVHEAYMLLRADKARNAFEGLGSTKPRSSASTSHQKPPRKKTPANGPEAKRRNDPMDSRGTLGSHCSKLFSKAKEKYAFEHRQCRRILDKVV